MSQFASQPANQPANQPSGQHQEVPPQASPETHPLRAGAHPPMLVWLCDHCTTQLSAQASLAGRAIQCPACGAKTSAPGAPRVGESVWASQSAASAPADPFAPSVPPPIPPRSAFSSASPGVYVESSTQGFAPPTGVGYGEYPPGGAGTPPPAYGAAGAFASAPMGLQRRPKCDRTIYVLLGIFLGWVGVHNFAAGYASRGTTQLILGLVGVVLSGCTLGVSFLLTIATFIWSIVDVITVTRDSDGVAM